MFYFFFSYRDLKLEQGDKIAFSVPSGNFGNICAGMLAKKIGLPIDKFIASNNINNVVDRYINTKLYQPECIGANVCGLQNCRRRRRSRCHRYCVG